METLETLNDAIKRNRELHQWLTSPEHEKMVRYRSKVERIFHSWLVHQLNKHYTLVLMEAEAIKLNQTITLQ